MAQKVMLFLCFASIKSNFLSMGKKYNQKRKASIEAQDKLPQLCIIKKQQQL